MIYMCSVSLEKVNRHLPVSTKALTDKITPLGLPDFPWGEGQGLNMCLSINQSQCWEPTSKRICVDCKATTATRPLCASFPSSSKVQLISIMDQGAPPLQRSGRSIKKAAKRQREFEATEALRAPEDRLMRLFNWGAHIRREAAQRTIEKYTMLIAWYEDFSQHVLSNQEGEASKYFQPGGPRPSIDEVRQFLAWIARTHKGIRSSPTIQLSTMTGYLESLWGAAKYYNARFPTDETDANREFLTEELLALASLNRMPLEKPVAYPRT